MHDRIGTSLSEVLLALVLLSATAAWGLQATAAAERAVGTARAHRAALHRAERALADLNALPCDSLAGTRTVTEPRWHVTAERRRTGTYASDDVRLSSTRNDTIALHRSQWCD
jgi:Tfp pilus assembly protein PilV